jgi:hypothetical protein
LLERLEIHKKTLNRIAVGFQLIGPPLKGKPEQSDGNPFEGKPEQSEGNPFEGEPEQSEGNPRL